MAKQGLNEGCTPKSTHESKRISRGFVRASIADVNFGTGATLPHVNQQNSTIGTSTTSAHICQIDGSQQTTKVPESIFDAKSISTASGIHTSPMTTSDILFIKRLLFLRAQIDNEDNLTNIATLFDEEKFS